MELGEPYLRHLLVELTTTAKRYDITVRIAMLDPKWQDVKHINHHWPELCDTHHKALRNGSAIVPDGAGQEVAGIDCSL